MEQQKKWHINLCIGHLASGGVDNVNATARQGACA